MPIFFVFARMIGVLIAEAQAMGPAIKHGHTAADIDGRLGNSWRAVLFVDGQGLTLADSAS